MESGHDAEVLHIFVALKQVFDIFLVILILKVIIIQIRRSLGFRLIFDELDVGKGTAATQGCNQQQYQQTGSRIALFRFRLRFRSGFRLRFSRLSFLTAAEWFPGSWR